MAKPATRQQLIDYCKRQLGAPVLQINIDDAQVDDIIDTAIQFYQEWHYDGVELMYLKHQITEEDYNRFNSSDEITTAPNNDGWENRNNYIEVPDHVIGVTRIFGVSSNWIRNDLFGLSNQYFLMDIFSFSSGFAFGNFDMTNYYMIRQYFETLDMVVNTGALVQYRFNKRQDRLYIDIDKARMTPGNYLLIECHRALDPASWTQIWNDSFLKKYTTALMKKQWGMNLIKYNGVQLPGGITLNGRQIYEDALQEIQELENDMPTKYTLPPIDMIG